VGELSRTMGCRPGPGDPDYIAEHLAREWQFLFSLLILEIRREEGEVKIALVTIGCKLNQYETDALAERLREQGFTVVDGMDEADMVVINTCTVTNTADSKSRQYMKQARRQGKRVVVTGCYATTDGEEILRRGLADIVLPNEHKFSLPSLLLETEPSGQDDFPLVEEYERTRAYLKIQDGCNRFCSYCKIPYGRGRSRSLSAAEALRRWQLLIDHGYREIILTGVNISDYRDQDMGLADLVARMLQVPGDYRLRLSSLQPDQFEEKLLDVLHHPRMTPHLHLSLQSGSGEILRRMRRHYTPMDFLRLCERIRHTRSDTALTTDIIVGFPGETEAHVSETRDLLSEVPFSRVHFFSYSPRAGTWAASQPQIPEEVKKARLHELERHALSVATSWVHRVISGRQCRMLVEETVDGMSYGYTEHYLYTRVQGSFAPNTFVSLLAGDTWLHQGAVALTGQVSAPGGS